MLRLSDSITVVPQNRTDLYKQACRQFHFPQHLLRRRTESRRVRADYSIVKNIYIPPKSPFNPPKGGFSSFAPRHSSNELDSALGLSSVEKGRLCRHSGQKNLPTSPPRCNQKPSVRLSEQERVAKGKPTANAAIKPRAETACRLCRGGAVKGYRR